MANWLKIDGKVALVTGASRGIGETIARSLAAEGVRVVVNYVLDASGRNEADARRIAAELPGGLAVKADVSNDEEVASLFNIVRDELGGMDILVNNAGILRDRSLRKMSLDEWNSVINVNLGGVFNCIRHAQHVLRDGGRIINLSSVSGTLGFFGQANYAASKAGVMSLTRVAAREFARQRITVNAIAPGFVDTEILAAMPDDVKAKFIEQIPLGRLGKPQDIADAVTFLSSDRAQFITGQVIHINGGFFMG